MNKKTLALSGLALSSMMALGCGSPNNTDAGMGGSDTPVPTMEPVSRTYIVGAITIPEAPDAMNRVPGFNLDATDSMDGGGDGCVGSNPDYTSLTGEAGVDNLFVGSLVSTIQTLGDINVQTSVNEQIASGSLLLAMRVNDINSFANDSSVTLDLFLVKQGDCAGETCPVVGGVMAGGAWTQRDAAYATGVSGSITAGSLRATVPSLPLNFTASGTMVNLTIQNANIGATITEGGLATGQIGGGIAFSQLVTIAMMLEDSLTEETLRSVVDADLNPRAADANTCDGISVGLGFTAVSAASVTTTP